MDQRGNGINLAFAKIECRHACRENPFADQITEPGNWPLPQVAFPGQGWTILTAACVCTMANRTAGRKYLLAFDQPRHARGETLAPFPRQADRKY